MLEAISNEGYLKKVAANNVLVTPNSKSSVRLDELNSLLQMAGKGEVAKNTLGRLENSQGMRDPAKIASTDAFVSETVNMTDLAGASAAAPVVPAVDQNMLMMEMLKTMQSIQTQLSEMKSDSEPKKARGRPKASV
jgi:hypothetical protein